MFDFSEYSVEIKNKEFKADTGQVYPNTCFITFRNKVLKKSLVRKIGFIDTETIYKMIDSHEPLIFDHCYINNFSLTEYRKTRKLGEREPVNLSEFSARYAVFDSLEVTDFNYGLFNDGDISFENAWFINGETNFKHANFGKGNLIFAYSYFKNGNLDFSNAHMSGGDLEFKNSVIGDGLKDFQYATLGIGNVSFVNTEFGNGDVNFINTNFSDGDVSFKVARFGNGVIDFHFAKFGEGDVTFERVSFGNGKFDFRTVEFRGGRINFNRCVFGDGDIDFEGSELRNSRISFKSAVMGSGNKNFSLMDFENTQATFDNTEFGAGNISFYNSRFDVVSFRGCHLDRYFDLRMAKCNTIDLSNTIVRDIIDFRPYEFPVNIRMIIFSSMRLLGRIYIDWDINNVKSLIENQPSSTNRGKAEQFRILKQNFNVTGQYDDEDKAYVEFKRLEQKAILEESLKKNKLSALWEYPAYAFKWLVFDRMGLFATAPARVLISVIFVWFIFTIIYFLLPLFGPDKISSAIGNPESLTYLGLCMSHSAITFFTIGYGDTVPYGSIARLFSGFEGFVGVFMMSYFTVAFVRKILR